MYFFISFLEGIAIGAGAILPGISSGVLCVIFGIYENMLNCILNFFKNIKYNFKVLFPIALGFLCGIILLGNLLRFVFYAYPTQTNFLFILLILSSIPELIKKATSKQHFQYKYLIYLTLSFLFGLILVFLENHLHTNALNKNEFSFFYIVLSGLLMSGGVIIPGISSTLILMILGVYDAYLISISSLYFPFLFPLLIGLSIGSFIWMKIIKYLLDKFYEPTFFCIIGFTLGTLFKIGSALFI